MEWEIGTLGRGKYRLSLFRIAEGETLCEVLESGTAHACAILAGDLDVFRHGGTTNLASSGNVATMTGPGTYCLHANSASAAPSTPRRPATRLHGHPGPAGARCSPASPSAARCSAP